MPECTWAKDTNIAYYITIISDASSCISTLSLVHLFLVILIHSKALFLILSPLLQQAERGFFMKNQKPLIVRYQGKRIEINLVIKDCLDDVEIRAKLQDPDYKASWKAAYLDSIYEEQLN